MNRDTYPVVENASKHKSDPFKMDGQARQSDARLKQGHQRSLEMDSLKGMYGPLGHNSAGNPMTSLRGITSKPNPRTATKEVDMRRNLYVLGLPFDLTKSDFANVFAPFGTVAHAVILATVDSASRRRGFVVMSTHAEARAAMNALSRTQIKGHTLDVSWAVVQRSQGFLDGADRTMMLASSASSPLSGSDALYANTTLPHGSENPINSPWNLSHMPTSKLLVSNLPTLLFTVVADLHPLFYPFGPIKDTKILGPSPNNSLDGTVAAVVEYVNPSSAQEAKETLQFQSYAGYQIGVHYIYDNMPMMDERFVSLTTVPHTGYGKGSDTGLNPFAPPFTIGSRFLPGNQMHEPQYNVYHSSAIPSGMPSDTPVAPQPLPMHLRPHVSDAISRSSSATSSK
ncbi:hypothetical protein HYDPIDRAFT_182932 [Hydnomerulius pinastri MD-312]|uniref:RRM domain-containing protein n=1 Tax=Hydnomerulius pinastri MD-312 TaxID=994086 RepID=A0A0C9V950_9AGAM|nr:hypothetical protein HYDPIDRAFT_182932 [Hydnomerulius pinastri MD-312]